MTVECLPRMEIDTVAALSVGVPSSHLPFFSPSSLMKLLPKWPTACMCLPPKLVSGVSVVCGTTGNLSISSLASTTANQIFRSTTGLFQFLLNCCSGKFCKLLASGTTLLVNLGLLVGL
jgi:hypothetical protein